MLEFELEFLKKIRLWFYPNKHLMLSNTNMQIRNYSSCINENFNSRTIIIELFVPRGGRIIYGLLGADYVPEAISNVNVSIPCGDNFKTNVFDDSLIEKIEPAHLSLSFEYCNAIFNQIDSISKQGNLKLGGKLNFCYGATSEVSSSPWIFGKLTDLIINLFDISENKINSDLLNKIINS